MATPPLHLLSRKMLYPLYIGLETLFKFISTTPRLLPYLLNTSATLRSDVVEIYGSCAHDWSLAICLNYSLYQLVSKGHLEL